MNALLSVALISTVAVAMEAPHNSDEIIEEPDYDLFVGRFLFVKQYNYLQYLEALGIPYPIRSILVKTTPECTIQQKEDDGLLVEYINGLATLDIDVNFNQTFDVDPFGVGKKQFFVSLKAHDTILATEVDSPNNTMSGQFYEEGFTLTLTAANGVKGIRTFKRV